RSRAALAPWLRCRCMTKRLQVRPNFGPDPTGVAEPAPIARRASGDRGEQRSRMQIRNLGRSGLQVSLVGLGCNNFGGRLDLAATRKVVHRALDLGITLFDTADIYGERGRSEQYLGESLGDRLKDIVLATKFGMAMDDAGTPQGSFPALHPVRGRGEPATA